MIYRLPFPLDLVLQDSDNRMNRQPGRLRKRRRPLETMFPFDFANVLYTSMLCIRVFECKEDRLPPMTEKTVFFR